MSDISISIIIPVYNVERYLSKCLDSVFCQPITEFEVICVNDGSTDGSLNILRQYEKQYQNLIIIDVENGGTAWARNHGMEVAKGEYIWFVDSDDWIEPNSIDRLKAHVGNKPDILCFHGKLWYESDGHEEYDMPIEDVVMTGWEYYNKYALVGRKFHFVCVVLRLYRRDFLLSNNLFFEKEISFEDNLWIPIVMYHAQSVELIPDLLYIYRIREGSKMQSFSFKRLIDSISVANKLSEFFIPLKNTDKTVVYREISGIYFGAFMSDKIKLLGNKDIEIGECINWKNFKQVSVYKRHRLIYKLLRIYPTIFRGYIYVEGQLKKIVKI